MKSIYRSALLDELERQLKDVDPAFLPRKARIKKSEGTMSFMAPGEMIFSSLLPSGTEIFLCFVPHRTQETLLLNFGWSRKARFPFDIPRVGSITQDRVEFGQDEFMADFGSLYHAAHKIGFWGWDVWKCSVDPQHPRFKEIFVREDLAPVSQDLANSRIRQVVQAALSDVKSLAIPYFQQFERFSALVQPE